jgi:muconate cycloisomerase
MARVATASPIPICADESAHSLQDIAAFGPTAVAGVSLKLIKLGGISGVMRGAVVCDTVGLEINLAGKIAESSIAAAANLHCAGAISDLRFGCSTGNQSNAADVTESPIRMSDGIFEIPTGPGLGVDVDETLVKALAS